MGVFIAIYAFKFVNEFIDRGIKGVQIRLEICLHVGVTLRQKSNFCLVKRHGANLHLRLSIYYFTDRLELFLDGVGSYSLALNIVEV